MAEIDDILRKMVNELGINILNDSRRFKAVFMDYSNGKYRGEMELVKKALDIGAFNAITNAEDVSIAKQILIKRLHDDYLFDENKCINIIETYTSVLRKDNIPQDMNDIISYKNNDNNTLNTSKFLMKHINSAINLWSFDVPIFFESMHVFKQDDFWDAENISILSGDDGYNICLLKHKKGSKPLLSLFAKRIETLSAYIECSIKADRLTILNQKRIEINGLSAEYYQVQSKNAYYRHEAYLERERFFYCFDITVPLDKRFEYQKQMDAFIYSVKLG
jgi:hypothetical protein